MDQTVEKPKPILDYKDLKDSRDIIKLERAPILQFGVHRAACSSFGDEAPARLCQIIVESNKAFLQEVLDNKVDLLDIYENEELLEVDDLGKHQQQKLFAIIYAYISIWIYLMCICTHLHTPRLMYDKI